MNARLRERGYAERAKASADSLGNSIWKGTIMTSTAARVLFVAAEPRNAVRLCGNRLKKMLPVVSLVFAFVFFAALPRAAFAQADLKPGDAATALADLDRRLEKAAVIGDAELLERYLGDDLRVTHDGGIEETKREWIVRARRIPGQYFFAREVSHQTVETHGDVALVVGRLDLRGFGPRGDPTKTPPNCSAIEYVHLYARRNNQWTLASNRTTRMIEPFHPCSPRDVPVFEKQ